MPRGLASEGATVLEASGVVVSYGRSVAVEGVNLTVAAGGLVLLLGPNGAGKTSLVNALAGAVRLAAGTVRLHGRDVSSMPAFRRVREGISLVPEGRGTLAGLTVHENLFLGWRAARRGRRGSFADAEQEMISVFPWMAKRLGQDCATLSGGEMQMLAIARAVLSRPQVLMLDEPSLGLAPQMVATVYRVLGQLSRGGLTMVIVEQKAVPLDVLPERTMVLQQGRVVWELQGRRPTEDELAALYLKKSEVPA